MSAPSELAVQRLPSLPISFFAMVVGLTGLTIAWEKAQHVFDIDLHVNVWLAGASAAVFILLLVLYTSKLARLRLRPTSRDRPFGKLGSDHRCRCRNRGRIVDYDNGNFLTLLLFTQVARFAKLELFLSWWAYSFPLAAISITSMLMLQLSGVAAYRLIGTGLLLLLTVIVALLLVRTGIAVAKYRICVPGH